MKNIRLLLIIFSISFIGCKAKKDSVTTLDNQSDLIEFIINEEFQPGEKIELQIKNNSDNEIVLINPDIMHIEISKGDDWNRLRILYCMCGASCPPPREEVKLTSGKIHSYTWNQKETWCGDLDERGIPGLVEKEAESGEYRFLITYELEGEIKEKYIRFIII